MDTIQTKNVILKGMTCGLEWKGIMPYLLEEKNIPVDYGMIWSYAIFEKQSKTSPALHT